jgi:inosose dehydratase
MTTLLERIAGAPITWGVCEVPDWGYQMVPEKVLDEMSEVGLTATELGPDGFLPRDPSQLYDLLIDHDLEMVAGFVPAVLYRAGLLANELAYVERAAATLAAVGATVMVLGPAAAVDGAEGYEERFDMDDEDWMRFAAGLDQVIEIGARHGLEVVVHPHWGMVIERTHQIERLLETSRVGICVDTGHLGLAGADPVKITELAGDRVRHVHLKDIDNGIAARVRAGELSYHDGAAMGLYRPLGEGDLDIVGVIEHLESIGFGGWYVLEQDMVLPSVPAEGSGPIEAARASYAFLERLAGAMDPEGGSSARS